MFVDTETSMGSRGVETPNTPDEPDALDAGDVVEGVGVDVLATGCRVRRVVWCFQGAGWRSGSRYVCEELTILSCFIGGKK